jgi:hypothetical protein
VDTVTAAVPVSGRQHGTLAMRRRGECATDPCDPCLEEGRRYERNRSKLHVMGRKPYVAAGRARAHVQRLLAGGMTVRQVEAASGVNRTAIRVMLGDFPGRKRSEQIRPWTERALLIVRGNLGPARSGTATVDAAGTRRRLEALQAIGYPARELAQRLGAGPRSPLQVARRARVRAATARAVADLYAALENTPGPSHRVAVTAQARGFLAPAWWDTDTIDDPDKAPVGLCTYIQGDRYLHGPRNVLFDVADAPRLARIELLLSRGLTRREVAGRLGIPLRYVSRDLVEDRVAGTSYGTLNRMEN